MMSGERERIKRTGLERRKTEGVEAADKGCGEMKGAAGGEARGERRKRKKRGETERRIAKHG